MSGTHGTIVSESCRSDLDPPRVPLDWQKSSNEDENSFKTSNQIHLADSFVDTANAEEIVVSSGGVVKRVVQQGSGDVVPLHATCLVHYVGRVLSNGEIFMDTCRGDHASPVQMIAGRDAIVKERGIHKVLATMKVGEICHVWVSPEFGYGSKGNFSFPSIPPNAHLSYAIEMVDFEAPRGTDVVSATLTYEERIEAAVRRRMQGNAFFQEGDVDAAVSSYTSGLAFLDDDFIMQLYEFHYDRAMEEKILLLGNLAACHVKHGSYHDVIRVTSDVLAVDTKNIKALFRRGSARRKLGQTAEALDDLRMAKKLSEETSQVDPGILREIAAAKKDTRDQSKVQGSLYKAMIDSTLSAPTAQDVHAEEDQIGEDGPVASAATCADVETASHPSWYNTMIDWLCPWWATRGSGVGTKEKAT
ncbi:hypothetical protein M9434_000452 [Picochlorum sp. BPE23]|nr:hypothetical protein M9434_000452 [Picochlorum sp. BPE23]